MIGMIKFMTLINHRIFNLTENGKEKKEPTKIRNEKSEIIS